MRALVNLSYAVIGLAMTLQVWLATQLPAFAGMYRDFGGTLPRVTRIALSSGWRFGAPIVVGALLVLAIAKRHTHPRLPIGCALVAVAILGGTYLAVQYPIFQLAGSIH